MTAEDTSAKCPGGARDDVRAVPSQERRRAPLSPADRLVRQVQAIDAWVAERRRQELALDRTGLSRDQRMDATRQVEVLRRTHDTIRGRCALAMTDQVGPLRGSRTAVLAHRQLRFAEKTSAMLGARGVRVLAVTDNGAEALGVVVSEQPDLLLVGESLAMVRGPVLLREARLFSPGTLRALQTSADEHAPLDGADADLVFLRRHPPVRVADAVADALLAGG